MTILFMPQARKSLFCDVLLIVLMFSPLTFTDESKIFLSLTRVGLLQLTIFYCCPIKLAIAYE